MSDDSTTQCLLFPDIFRKPVVARFDQREGSSDGGALLLKAVDRRVGLLDELTAGLEERRQAGKVDHSLRELMAQRVFSIACGYPDGNDSARLAKDPKWQRMIVSENAVFWPRSGSSTIRLETLEMRERMGDGPAATAYGKALS